MVTFGLQEPYQPTLYTQYDCVEQERIKYRSKRFSSITDYPNHNTIPINTQKLQIMLAKLYLLNNLTPAEEAVLQRIIPLLSLVHLTHENIELNPTADNLRCRGYD